MLTIWKFPLLMETQQTVQIPRNARLLSVEEQAGTVVLYALVDPTAEKESRFVWIFGTGHHVPDQILVTEFLGTVKMLNGGLMFHVFA